MVVSCGFCGMGLLPLDVGEVYRWRVKMLGLVLVSFLVYWELSQKILTKDSHFLRRSSDISRSLDDALSAVVVLVELCAEAFEHGHERRLGGVAAVVAVLVGHCCVWSFDAHWISVALVGELCALLVEGDCLVFASRLRFSSVKPDV